jgi:hypothetical protein
LYSTQKHPDDVVITLAIRTPLTKGHKGGFKDTTVDGIVVKLLTEVVQRMNMDPAIVEDVCLGNVSYPTLIFSLSVCSCSSVSYSIVSRTLTNFVYFRFLRAKPLTTFVLPLSRLDSQTPLADPHATASARPASRLFRISPTRSAWAASNVVLLLVLSL